MSMIGYNVIAAYGSVTCFLSDCYLPAQDEDEERLPAVNCGIITTLHEKLNQIAP